jgi:uncharacterized protein (TIGR00268 family)
MCWLFIGTSPVHPDEKQTRHYIADSWGLITLLFKPKKLKNIFTLYNESKGEVLLFVNLAFLTRFGKVARVARGIIHVFEGFQSRRRKTIFGQEAARLQRKGVVSPLKAVGLTKADIRELSRMMNLTTHDKPSFACLASRVPYGTTITKDILRQIELSEELLKGLGFRQIRVRYHGEVARIEVEGKDFAKIIENRGAIQARLEALGFTYITVDLKGYRTGSLNKTLAESSKL